MRIAFLSNYGDAADLAFRMSIDGHKVKLYIDDSKSREVFEGLVPKAKTWEEAVKGADLVVFDDNKLSHIWKKVNRSVPCFGGSDFASRLESDRGFAHALMERVGIPSVESLSFKTFPEVIKHLKEDKKAHVIKPQGDDVKSHHLIIGEEEDNEDAIAQVERLMELGLKTTAIEVEERKRGVEVALTMFFNGFDRVGPVCINFEHKRSHNGEKGYLTGEQGTLVRYLEDPDIPLYQDTLAKFIPILRAHNYRGVIDLNMIVGREKNGELFRAPLEFTPRLGKPICFIQDELHVTPWADIFAGIANGVRPDIQVHYQWGVGILLCGFGFPFEDQATEISKGLHIKGLDENSLEHLHPMEIRLDKKGRFVHAGGEGYVLVATGKGEEKESAKNRAYHHLRQVQMPNSYYRDDITDKINLYDLEQLEILPLEETGHASMVPIALSR